MVALTFLSENENDLPSEPRIERNSKPSLQTFYPVVIGLVTLED